MIIYYTYIVITNLKYMEEIGVRGPTTLFGCRSYRAEHLESEHYISLVENLWPWLLKFWEWICDVFLKMLEASWIETRKHKRALSSLDRDHFAALYTVTRANCLAHHTRANYWTTYAQKPGFHINAAVGLARIAEEDVERSRWLLGNNSV